MKQADGFVLISVLFIVMVMMLLTLSQWQSLLMFERIMATKWYQEERLRALESALFDIWLSYQRYQEEACVKRWCEIDIKTDRFKYYIKQWGAYPCIHVTQLGRPHSTEHVQITIENTVEPVMRLSVRLAQAVPLMPCSSHEYRYVESQVLSWDYD